MEAPIVRNATEADLDAILGIYTHEVLTGFATFEIVPPTRDEMVRRRADVLARGLPYLVAEMDGEIAGYAYAGPYRTRPAYAATVEDSVYVARSARGRGVGLALLSRLVARCEAGPWRQMVAIIGDSGNTGSVALHRKAGFGEVGVLRNVGFKLGRWVDTAIMQRPLGAGHDTPPEDGAI